jgi:geranylgeranyl reductase family protein
VIVVGAGPGGSNAATVCLESGLSVLQLDAKPFPRVKPCAGGLTPKSLAALRGDLGDQLRGDAQKVEFTCAAGEGVVFELEQPLLRFVHRPAFDAQLVSRNRLREGFRFLAGKRVESVRWDGTFLVETPGGSFRGRQLIGADGSSSVVNRVFKIAAPRGQATAVETEIRRPVASSICADPCFDFGAVDGGYGWVFPKDDHWSVGLYTIRKSSPRLKEKLERYVRAKGLGEFEPGEVLGHCYGIGGYRLNPPSVPVYLVGDAGGFAEAITGEGIYYALKSGALAGATAVRVQAGLAQSGEYYRLLWRDVLWDTRVSWHAARLFYRNPQRWIGLLKNPLVWRPLVEGYAEGSTLSGCVFRGWRHLFKPHGGHRTRVTRS